MKKTSAFASTSTGVSRLYAHRSSTLGIQLSPPPAEAGCSASGVNGADVGSTIGAGSGGDVAGGIVGAGTGGSGVGVGAEPAAVIRTRTKSPYIVQR